MAISPLTQEANAKFTRRLKLDFPLLSDRHNAYAKELGLVFALPEAIRTVYTGFGIVLPDHNGDDSWELPLPTRLVVDAAGVIRSVDADPDYTVRPEPEASLEVLRGLG